MSARTLVISDLHIGARDGLSVVERQPVLELLLAEIDRCERLVLLGDLIELQEAEAVQAFALAKPILKAIGARLGPDREVVYLPGNHDRPLIRGWLAASARTLEPESLVPADASPPLQQLLELLAPARVEVRYPGIWLTERIWAHHGHYLDRYLVPGKAYGLMPGRARRSPTAKLRVADFEPRGRRGEMRSLVRLLPQRAAAGVEDVEEIVRAATMPRPAAAAPTPIEHPPIKERPQRLTSRPHEWLLHPGLSPLVSYLLGLQVRRHSVPAVTRVAHDLGRRPEYLLFGHVHRRGPIDGDDLSEWEGGGTRVLNTGSWRWEPVLVQRARPPHPYWPGGAIAISEDGLPRSLGLLDGLSRAELLGLAPSAAGTAAGTG